jgi:hypothetical protein
MRVQETDEIYDLVEKSRVEESDRRSVSTG